MKMIQNRWVIRPDKVVEFIEALKNHMKWTREDEPGCWKFDIVCDENDNKTFHLYELYEDEKAIEKHSQSLTLAEPLTKFQEWLVQYERFTSDLILKLEKI